MNRTLLSALIVVGLAGCAASPNLPSTYALDTSKSEGLVVVSLILSGKSLDQVSEYAYPIREVPLRGEAYALVSQHYASARQHARSVHADDSERPLALSVVIKGPPPNNTDTLDIRNIGKATGRVAALRLPPGDYEFHAWQVREPSSHGETEYRPAREFSYRFSIRPGEATYIGRLNLHLGSRTTARITVNDRRAEDMSLLGQKYPALRAARIVAALGTLQP